MNRSNQRQYYRLLHVQYDAPIEVIRASYRTIMQKLKQHPDLGGDEANASLLNEAYAVLSNPERRAKYDRQHEKPKGKNVRQGFQPWSAPQNKSSGRPSPNTRYAPMTPAYCPFCQASIPYNELQDGVLSDCRVCDSPLTPVKRNRQASSCKRALKRTSVRGLVHFLTKWPQFKEYVGEIQDLSPMGIKFVYGDEVPLETLIKIDSRGLKAVGRVVSCYSAMESQHIGYCVCVEFITLSYRGAQGVFVSEKV